LDKLFTTILKVILEEKHYLSPTSKTL